MVKDPLLVIEDLQVDFGKFQAVGGISLTVPRGAIFGFLGPNGAGKTTTIKVLTGQLRPSSGRVTIDGKDLVSDFSRLKTDFGYVPDFDNHLEEFTAEENLRLYCGLYNQPRARITEVLQIVELLNERKIRVKHFSKGMKKKLTIAREILHNPTLLFLDEPTANLDAHSKDNVRSLLSRIRENGGTVFLTTHDMEEAEQLCDQIAILHSGKIIDIDSPLLFKSRYSENLVDIAYREGEQQRQITLKMHDSTDRAHLSTLITEDRLVAIHSREFNFRQVFLKLTGQEYE